MNQIDRVVSERPIPINDAARHDLDRDLFAARHALRRRPCWIDVTPGMREHGISTYPPEYVDDIRLVPIGRRDGNGAA